jgi:hypothetical protein
MFLCFSAFAFAFASASASEKTLWYQFLLPMALPFLLSVFFFFSSVYASCYLFPVVTL